MRLLVLDENFKILEGVPLYRSLIWTRRYEMPGCFELHVQGDTFALLSAGRYLYRNDADELGVISQVGYSQDERGGRSAYAKGYFAESLLADRVVAATAVLLGTPEECMRELVRLSAAEPAEPGRKIPRLSLGGMSAIPGEAVHAQVTGANLGDKLYEIGNAYGISHRVRYDFLADALYFEVWQGKDRRDTQDVNSWAVFSNAFCNVLSMSYGRDRSSHKNFAYVAGAGEGAGREVVRVDLREPGEGLRELWVDARDLQLKDGDGIAIPPEAYRAQLAQRGREKLAEYCVAETVEARVGPSAGLRYREDFDLGDLCTYMDNEAGIAADRRVTEVTEAYEGAAPRIDVRFGSCGAQTVRQLVRREAWGA